MTMRDTKQNVNVRLTEPEVGAKLPSLEEQVDKGQVHEDVADEHDKDICRVGALLYDRGSELVVQQQEWRLCVQAG